MSEQKKIQNFYRRDFLERIGAGMLIAGAGASAAAEIGCATESTSHEEKDSKELSFGTLNGLVDLMQQQNPDDLQRTLVSKLENQETNLKQIVAAAALANAETFGGQDYVGYHTEMALVPAFDMAQMLSADRKALPVLKVVYRNAQQIQSVGGARKKTLRPIANKKRTSSKEIDAKIVKASREANMDQAESHFAAIENVPVNQRFNAILPVIQDDINVHRFVLAHRAFELIDIVGADNAQTMLRQCVRYCVDSEKTQLRNKRAPSPIRTVLPKLVSQFQLQSKPLGTKDPGDEWIEEMSKTIYNGNQFEASEAVAAAIAEGIAPPVIAEAISVAANLLVLKQHSEPWRTHGDSAGVHASDAVNAWRHILPAATKMNAVGGLICSAFHTGMYPPFQNDAYPTESHRLKVKVDTAKELLGIAEEAIRSNDQGTAAAAAQVYGERGYDPSVMFGLLLRYAISEDGRLHAEKYFRTAYEEYTTMRKRFKLRQLVSLARVTASSFGYDRFDNKGNRAPGYESACQLLKVKS